MKAKAKGIKKGDGEYVTMYFEDYLRKELSAFLKDCDSIPALHPEKDTIRGLLHQRFPLLVDDGEVSYVIESKEAY